MGKVEQRINSILQRFPGIKTVVKRVYQRTMYTVLPKIKSEGEINCITPNDEFEYFFGYYDKSPWNATGRYMLCNRVRNAYAKPDNDDEAQLVLIDTQDNNRISVIGTTRAWNVQQGCMLQWLGPDFSSKVIYNDFREGRLCAVILELESKQERIIDKPVYSVSQDGEFALTLDFTRLHRLRPGYGYCNIPETTAKELCPDQPCIWKVNLASGQSYPLFTYKEIADFEAHPDMAGAEHKVNHLMIAPDGSRFMVLHRWFVGKNKHTRLLTANCDGADLYNLLDDGFVSHCYWKNSNDILTFANKSGAGRGYFLLKDKSNQVTRLWTDLHGDGHPSYSVDGRVVTDTYADRRRLSSIYILNEDKNELTRVARVYSPFRYDNDVRCDLHPRWSRDGKQICFDAVYQGKRSLNVVDVKSVQVSRDDRVTIMYLFTNIKRKGPSKQTSYIINALDKQKFKVVLVTMFKEQEGNSLLDRYLPIVDEHICLNISKKGILKGELKKVREVIKQYRPNIVQSMGVLPSYLADKYARPIHCMTVRNYAYEDLPAKHGKLVGLVLAVLQMRIIRNCKYKVACSKSLADIYAERNNLHFGAIRNSVELNQYHVPSQKQREQMREKLNLPKDKKIFVYAAQINSRKNQMFAAEAISAANREDLCLVFLGAGPMLEEMKTKFIGNPQIIMTGEVTNVIDYLYAADVYFSTSKSEGMPNGVMEAMACGLPVILSDIPQHKEILDMDSRIGATYASSSLPDAINAICRIAASDYRNMGQLARVLVEKEFDAVSMGKKYEQLYEEIAHQNQ